VSEIKESDFGRIRFIGVPKGYAPLEVRSKWVGLEVPCLYRMEANDGTNESEFVRSHFTQERVAVGASYVVLQGHAIPALWKTAPEAAMWYIKAIGLPSISRGMFTFNVESAEPLTRIMTSREYWLPFSDA
jgi:hypothetical protein